MKPSSSPEIQQQLQKFRKEYHKKIARKQGIHLRDIEIDLTKSDTKIQQIVRQRIKQLNNDYSLFKKIFYGILIIFLTYQIWFIFENAIINHAT